MAEPMPLGEFLVKVIEFGYVVTLAQAENGQFKAGVLNKKREYATATAETAEGAIAGAVHALSMRKGT